MTGPRRPTGRSPGAGTSPGAAGRASRRGSSARSSGPASADVATRSTGSGDGASDPPVTPGARVSLTSRAAVLGVVLLVLGLSFAYPLRNWYAQRTEINDLREQRVTEQQAVDDLHAQIDRWDDPAYVASLARERLHFVRPGETLYVVIGDNPSTPQDEANAEITASGGQWWQRLWATVEAADDGTRAAPGGAGG